MTETTNKKKKVFAGAVVCALLVAGGGAVVTANLGLTKVDDDISTIESIEYTPRAVFSGDKTFDVSPGTHLNYAVNNFIYEVDPSVGTSHFALTPKWVGTPFPSTHAAMEDTKVFLTGYVFRDGEYDYVLDWSGSLGDFMSSNFGVDRLIAPGEAVTVELTLQTRWNVDPNDWADDLKNGGTGVFTIDGLFVHAPNGSSPLGTAMAAGTVLNKDAADRVKSQEEYWDLETDDRDEAGYKFSGNLRAIAGLED